MRHATTRTTARATKRRAVGAALTAAAVGLVPAVAVIATATAAEPVVISTDFEGGDLGGWEARGTASVAAVEVGVDAHEGTGVMAVTERGTESWHAAQIAIGDLDPVPESYTVEAYVRLAPGTDPSQTNLGLSAPGHPDNENPWVGGREDVTADAWTLLSGSYTVDPSAPPAYINVEVTTAGVDFWVDSVTITAIGEAAPPAAEDEVLRVDFEDGAGIAPFVDRGAATGTVTDSDAASGSQSVLVTGRTDGWHGIQLDLLGWGLEPGSYQISAMVKLAPTELGQTGMHVTVNQEPFADGADQYKTVGGYQTPVGTDEWVEIGGTYVLTEDRTKAELYIDVQAQGEEGSLVHPSFLMDDFVIVGEASSPPAFEPVEIYGTSFEDGAATDGWYGRGDATVATTTAQASEGSQSLLTSARADSWQGPGLNLLDIAGVESGAVYEIEAYVRLVAGSGQANLSVAENVDGTADYPWVSGWTDVDAESWALLTGEYTFTGEATQAELYIETDDVAHEFYVDAVTITVIGEDFVPGGAVDPTTSQVTTARGEGNVAALTFDDGPNPGETEDLLDLLAANSVEATFCVVGESIQATGGAAILQRIVDEGHTLCNHSTSFADMGSWTEAEVEADLRENLRIIRDALGDPAHPVPYFRAPNGSWGATPQVAVDLGMQPLGLGNLIFDWDGEDQAVETLTANLRSAIQPGAVVLGHDGGGDRTNTIAAYQTVIPEFLDDGWTFTLPAERGPAPAPRQATVWDIDFDDESYDPWTQSGDPTLTYVDDGAGGSALSITRTADYEGIQSPLGELEAGVEYTLSMRVRLPDGETGPVAARFVAVPGYDWIGNVTLTSDGWTEITGTIVFDAEADLSEAKLYTGLGTADDGDAEMTVIIDDILVTRPATPGEYAPVDMFFDFEEGDLEDWGPRADGAGTPVVVLEDQDTYDNSSYSARVTDRLSQGSGLGREFGADRLSGDALEPGGRYEVTAQVKMGAGEAPDSIWLSLQHGASGFATLGQFDDITADEWVEVTAQFTVPSTAEMVYVYFETSYNSGGEGDFLVDDIHVVSPEPLVIQDLPSIHERHADHFPVGVAIDERETLGVPADLTTLHFNQITAENHMKVENWYDGSRNFRIDPQAEALMNFAAANDIRVYGHALAWHSQTPAWFFQDGDGAALTTSDADKQILRDRLRSHIFNVAETLHDGWGEYGGDNPIVAWDVVNEVISDGANDPDGMRQSEWYRILGTEFVDLAFRYADEAFNGTYAAEAADRPVTLFINDYNTEIDDKRERYYDLITGLLDRDVPIDGVGHQFHVYMTNTVPDLERTIQRFQGLGLTQAVTELDVNVGDPATEAKVDEQGYYYRDAFRMFRQYADDLFSVTVWGLTDDRSWRSYGRPLVFDAELQAKPAYYGIMDVDEAPLPDRVREATVFQGAVAIGAGAADDIAWSQLPLNTLESGTAFQARWQPDTLTVFVDVADTTVDAGDGVEVTLDGTSYTVDRDGTLGDGVSAAVVEETDSGYTVVAALALAPAVAEGDVLEAEVHVTDGGETERWASVATPGTFTLVEELSYVEVVGAPEVPEIDGEVDAAWSAANVVTTGKNTLGTGGATADVYTLWDEDTLYVLMEVAGADSDSVQIYLDAGNFKHGSYRYEETNIRISADNTVTFGRGGDTGFQAARVQSATSATDGGYVVEATIDLLTHSGLGTFHGLDFQVNDTTNGTVRIWADPTGDSANSSLRWGVGQLVEVGQIPTVPTITLATATAKAGGTVTGSVSGFEPGTEVVLDLEPGLGLLASGGLGLSAPLLAADGTVLPATVATVTIGQSGGATFSFTVPGDAAPGLYDLSAVVDGDTLASTSLEVLAADAPDDPGDGTGDGDGAAAPGTDGSLPRTGIELLALILAALVLLGGGTGLLLQRKAVTA